MFNHVFRIVQKDFHFFSLYKDRKLPLYYGCITNITMMRIKEWIPKDKLYRKDDCMAIDKKKNRQVLVTFPNELLEEVEDFQFANRIQNRSEAIRELIRRGLEKNKN